MRPEFFYHNQSEEWCQLTPKQLLGTETSTIHYHSYNYNNICIYTCVHNVLWYGQMVIEIKDQSRLYFCLTFGHNWPTLSSLRPSVAAIRYTIRARQLSNKVAHSPYLLNARGVEVDGLSAAQMPPSIEMNAIYMQWHRWTRNISSH